MVEEITALDVVVLTIFSVVVVSLDVTVASTSLTNDCMSSVDVEVVTISSSLVVVVVTPA